MSAVIAERRLVPRSRPERADRLPAGQQEPPRRPRAGRPGGHRFRLLPGWPITFAFAGFPLWWVLGISNFIGHIAAVLILFELLHRRRIRVPRSFGMWLLFLAWVAVGVLVLRVDAPDAAPVTSTGTYLTWAYRFGWYAAATLFMLYIGNMREQLSAQRIVRALSIFFLTIVAGGWLAILAPSLTFPSVLEVILPGSISHVEFIQFLIHPTVVQDYSSSAAGVPRPSAPFAYANFWGLNFAAALPFFVQACFGRPARWRRRVVGAVVLLLAAVPMILSWNRGLWATLLAMTLVLAVRSAFRGHIRNLVALILATSVVVGAILLSPLGGVIQNRLDNPASDSTREQLAALTTDGVLDGSPIVGFGSTRDPAASFYSIAGGDRPSCADCSPPAMGTQGQFWLVLFAQGVAGMLLFYGFILIWVVRGLRMRRPVSTVALCAVLAHLFTMTVYDSLGIGTVVLMVAIAMLWREHDESHPPGPATGGIYTMGGYIRLIRHNLVWIAVWAAAGMLVGVGMQMQSGNASIASMSVMVPNESVTDHPEFTTSLDTLNQLAHSAGVRSAIAEATGGEPGRLDVTATPNSRILNLCYTDHDIGSSLSGVTAATDALLKAHGSLLEAKRAQIVKQLDAEYASLLRSLSVIDSTLTQLGRNGDAAGVALLKQTRASVLDSSASVANESAHVGSLTFELGRAARPASARVSYDPLIIKAVSGLMLGLLGGVLTARLRDARRRRIRDVRDLASALAVGVIARLGEGSVSGVVSKGDVTRRSSQVRAVTEVIARSGAVAVMPGDNHELTGRLASLLDAELTRARAHPIGRVSPSSSRQIVMVASESARFGDLTWRAISHQRSGVAILGLILITDVDSRRPRRVRRRTRPRGKTESGAIRGTTSH